MARTFSRASRAYAAGSYGPFTLNGFSRLDADYLEAKLTVEGWPAGGDVATVSMVWDTGGGAQFSVSANPTDKQGNPLSAVTMRVWIPQTPDGKVAVNAVTINVNVLRPITTAVSLQAV